MTDTGGKSRRVGYNAATSSTQLLYAKNVLQFIVHSPWTGFNLPMLHAARINSHYILGLLILILAGSILFWQLGQGVSTTGMRSRTRRLRVKWS